jgi:hypothetical protein
MVAPPAPSASARMLKNGVEPAAMRKVAPSIASPVPNAPRLLSAAICRMPPLMVVPPV